MLFIKMLRNYFDYNSSTPVDKRILTMLNKFCKKNYGNISNTTYNSLYINKIFLECKEYISRQINANNSNEIIFTSGATESNNILIQGVLLYMLSSKKNIHIITTKYEHESVFNVLQFLESKYENLKITYINPDIEGMININDIESSINENTKMIICIHVHNEVGVINDIQKIGDICKKYNLIFHIDAAQSYGKIPIDVQKCNITSMSASGHKIYTLKGVGLLYINSNKKLRLRRIIFGGSQQKIRSGTIPIELIYTFWIASKLMFESMENEQKRLRNIQLEFHKTMLRIDNIHLNGPIDSRRIYNNLNYSINFIEGESIIMMCKKYTISTGSACQSDTLEASNSIACIKDIESAHSSIRISFGRYTTLKSAISFANKLKKIITSLRKRSPMI